MLAAMNDHVHALLPALVHAVQAVLPFEDMAEVTDPPVNAFTLL